MTDRAESCCMERPATFCGMYCHRGLEIKLEERKREIATCMGQKADKDLDPCPVRGTEDDWGTSLPCQRQAGHEGKHWYLLEWDDDGII